MKITHIIAYLSCCYLLSTDAYIFEKTDTLLQGRSMGDDEYLSSANKLFKVKIFSNSAADGKYLGIFYNTPSKTRNLLVDNTHPLWVANRDAPLVVTPSDVYELVVDDTDGLLKLKLYYNERSITISDCSPTTENTTATILDNGNLVLRMHNPDGSIKRTMWQSFDYPTDTLLPGMKLGINFRTGHNSSLTSWKSKDEPTSGSFTLGGDPNGTSQLMLWWQGSVYWRSGRWGKGNFNNTNLFGVDFNFEHISNENEKYLIYSQHGSFNLQHIRMDSDGVIHFVGRSASASIRFCSVPEDLDPGCVHAMERLPKCRKDEVEFYEWYGLVEGSSYIYDQSKNLSMFDCKAKCRKNCSCLAFTFGNNGTMCEIFTKVKLTPSKHGVLLYSLDKEEARRWWAWIVGAVIGLMLVIILCYFLWKGKDKTEEKMLLQELADTNISPGQYSGVIDKIGKKMKNQVQVFSFQSLEMATDDFSIENKLGEGGFGSVYKGKLLGGQEVAIKRLSRSSGQGLLEFKNEILLIAKLQHDNLVKLIGCCIKGKEKILVYEYMPNGSLDFFLFDSGRRESIKWTNRINIIQRVAQGLLYLHKYSRLRVIHRDLKASNILLDENMIPKISDFGMAKIFGKQDSEANTKRIVGTHGYMSPEYAIEGIFSEKSDVFSFGVMMLEIVTGKKNHGCYHSERPLNLTGLAWELWVEGRAKELMDTTILDETSYINEIIRCINVGLLCVQDNATDRPSMMDVVSMVTNESVPLPIPKQPAFFIGINTGYAATEVEIEKPCTNDLSFTAMDGR